VYWDLPADCFLTGVAVAVSSDDVKMMKLTYRRLNDDCSFSGSMHYTAGSSPTMSAEQSYTVPSGYAITGLGLLVENNNVTRMLIRYRELIPAGGGGFVLGYEQTANRGNNSSLEVSISTSNISSWANSNTVLTGLGLRAQNSGIYQIEMRGGRLQTL
jgi:hypothetical protein